MLCFVNLGSRAIRRAERDIHLAIVCPRSSVTTKAWHLHVPDRLDGPRKDLPFEGREVERHENVPAESSDFLFSAKYVHLARVQFGRVSQKLVIWTNETPLSPVPRLGANLEPSLRAEVEIRESLFALEKVGPFVMNNKPVVKYMVRRLFWSLYALPAGRIAEVDDPAVVVQF